MSRLAAMVVAAALLVPGLSAGAQDSFADQPIRSASTESPAAPESAAGPSVTRVGGSLLLVAGLIVGLGWAYRRFAATGNTGGGGAVTLVSRTVLTPKHQVMVLRVGHRLVVVGDAGQGMQPLCEVTDPAEVTAVLVAAGAGEADDDPVKAGAFAASFEHAMAPMPDGDDEPTDELESLGATGEEVRNLIERVRGLQAEASRPGHESTA